MIRVFRVICGVSCQVSKAESDPPISHLEPMSRLVLQGNWRALLLGCGAGASCPGFAPGAGKLAPLPDSTGWGVHVLTIARDPRGGLWLGTYGQGILRLRAGTSAWERIRSDTTATSLSWRFPYTPSASGSRGRSGTGQSANGWGVSTDDGATWTSWTPEAAGSRVASTWRPTASPPGETTVWIGTADGIQVTSDGGHHWIALGDKDRPGREGSGRYRVRDSQQRVCKAPGVDRRGVVITTPKGE